jgi:hypothetical protein
VQNLTYDVATSSLQCVSGRNIFSVMVTFIEVCLEILIVVANRTSTIPMPKFGHR